MCCIKNDSTLLYFSIRISIMVFHLLKKNKKLTILKPSLLQVADNFKNLQTYIITNTGEFTTIIF